MHWFWRAAIAVIAGSVAEFFLFVFLSAFQPQSHVAVYTVFLLLVASPVLTLRIYVKLGPGKTVVETETRCRKCGYILRGISEPRCPECGERI